MASTHLLINVGSRRSRESLSTIKTAFERHGFGAVVVHELKPGNDIGSTIKSVLSKQPELVIIGGGDGTVSDAVDHLVNKNVEVGIIPLGTTNNFARSLNLPLEIDDAVAAIKRTKARYVDLGKTNDEFFANVMGVGISALIASHVTDAAKKRYGRLAYAIVGMQQLIKHKAFNVVLQDKDNELKVNFETHQLIIANGRYHAGKQIASDAKLDNHELVIFALGGRNKLSFIWHTLDYYVGKRKQVAHTSYLSGKSIKISTITPQPIELDGETKYTTPVAVSVEPKAIKIRH